MSPKINSTKSWTIGKISRKKVKAAGGEMLFARYPSMEEILQANFPDFPWKSEKFSDTSRLPAGFFDDLDKQRELLERIGRELGVKQVSTIDLLIIAIE